MLCLPLHRCVPGHDTKAITDASGDKLMERPVTKDDNEWILTGPDFVTALLKCALKVKDATSRRRRARLFHTT
eukprot:1906920-Amphidinium_carterae.1